MLRAVLRWLVRVSLVLCLISGAMWLRGYRVRDSLAWSRRGGSFVQVDLFEGAILVRMFDGQRDARVTWQTATPPSTLGLYPFGGMTLERPYMTRPCVLFTLTSGKGLVFWHRGDRSRASVPGWSALSHWEFPTLAFAVLPVLALIPFTLRRLPRPASETTVQPVP